MRLKILILLFGVIAVSCDTKKEDFTEQKRRGLELSASLGKRLKSELQTAFKSGGFELAVPYCNSRALSLTDSLANAEDVSISRISDKNRNQKNKAQESDLIALNAFKDKSLKDTIFYHNEVLSYYKAIYVEEGCLKCHGQKEEIENYELIKKLYPEDKAINYSIGDLRGAFKVVF